MKSFISCSEMLHAKSVHRSKCVCSSWPEYLSANLWNVWCSIKIKSRLGIHGWANEIWSSLLSLPICKCINASVTDNSGYGDIFDSSFKRKRVQYQMNDRRQPDAWLACYCMYCMAYMYSWSIQDVVNELPLRFLLVALVSLWVRIFKRTTPCKLWAGPFSSLSAGRPASAF